MIAYLMRLKMSTYIINIFNLLYLIIYNIKYMFTYIIILLIKVHFHTI